MVARSETAMLIRQRFRLAAGQELEGVRELSRRLILLCAVLAAMAAEGAASAQILPRLPSLSSPPPPPPPLVTFTDICEEVTSLSAATLGGSFSFECRIVGGANYRYRVPTHVDRTGLPPEAASSTSTQAQIWAQSAEIRIEHVFLASNASVEGVVTAFMLFRQLNPNSTRRLRIDGFHSIDPSNLGQRMINNVGFNPIP